MKRKEKEQLKADPFVHFMQQAYAYVKGHRRPLLIGAAVVALGIVILLAVFLFRNLSSAGENKVYAEAFRVNNDGKTTVDQKIAALQKLSFRKGISASGHLFLAARHFQKGDLQQAEAVLAAMPKSRLSLINDQKHVLFAEVLAAAGRGKEAEAVLNRLLGEKKTAMAKEVILMKLARLHVQGKRSDEAIAVLKRVMAEYSETAGAMEARNLLAQLEGSDTAGL